MNELYKELGLYDYCNNYPYLDWNRFVNNRLFEVQELYNKGLIDKKTGYDLLGVIQ